MNIRNVVLTFGFLAAAAGIAQGPLYDKIDVTLPYPVSVNGTVLQPGEYVIRQHESTAGASRVVHFFKDGGMKLETTAMAIPALDNKTQEDTKLILDKVGSDYFLTKIWVQGKDYGYEFPIPENIRNREKERTASAATVTGTYQAAPAETVVTTPSTTTTVERTETAQATPAPEPAPAPAQAAPQVEATPAPAPAPQAEAAPAPAPEPAPMSADRPERTMPATAGNWLNMLLGGGLLSCSGLALRRLRA
jgi:hypothetical protein